MTIKEKTVAEKVEERLRNDIISGYFKEGERITIKEIAERYGVSAMPVRESFQTLKGERLLDMLPYRGAVVLPLDRKYVQDVLEVEALVQTVYSAKVCGEGVSSRNLKKMETLLEKMRKYGGDKETDEFMKLNLEFHRLGISACGNQKALELYEEYARLSNSLRHRYNMSPQRTEVSIKQHEEILRCYRERDVEGLKAVLMEHRSQAGADIIKTIIW